MSHKNCRGVMGKAQRGEGRGHGWAHSPQFWQLLHDQDCLWMKKNDQLGHSWPDVLLLRLQNQSSKQSQDKVCQPNPGCWVKQCRNIASFPGHLGIQPSPLAMLAKGNKFLLLSFQMINQLSQQQTMQLEVLGGGRKGSV